MTCMFDHDDICNVWTVGFYISTKNMLLLNMIRIQHDFRLAKEEGWRARSAFKLLQVKY